MSSFIELEGNDRPKKDDAKRIGDVDPNSRIEITLSLSGPALPDATATLGMALTPEDFALKYGGRRDDADKVARVLEGYGLKIEEVSLASRSMRVSGTAEAIEKAFQPRLAMYRSASQGEFRGREGQLKIPAE